MGEKIVLGITGSAAAFKGVALASGLRREGFDVDGVLTAAACEFIRPTQLSCITGRPVRTVLFGDMSDPAPHISLTDGCSLLVVAPATAHFLARAACGLADDLLTSVFLACQAPVIIAPAMNSRMWNNQATVNNVRLLQDRGVRLAGPVEGGLACGTTGKGRMMEPEGILAACIDALENRV